MDLALNNRKRLIIHKTQTTNQPLKYRILWLYFLDLLNVVAAFLTLWNLVTDKKELTKRTPAVKYKK